MEKIRYRENPTCNLLIAIFIAFCGRAVTVISFIYGVTLFLSFYPSIWLAYFFIFNHLFGISLSYPLSFLLGKESRGKRNSLIILISAASVFVIFFIMLQFDFYWLPFFISSSVGVIGSICEGMMTNAIPFGFSLREYKEIAQYTERTAIVSVITASFMIPLLTAYFPLNSLLFASIIFLIGSCFSLHRFTFLPQPIISRKAAPSNSLFSTLISRQVALFVILSTITWKFVEYTFQYELAQHYTGKGLADFQGYYSGVTNILGLVIAFSSTKYLLTHLRPGGMLYITQTLTLIGCLLVIFIPSLWTVYILAAIRIVFYYNYANISFDIFLNILPSAIRMINKFKIKIVIPSIANMSAALFLLLLSTGFLTTQGLIFLCSLITLPTFYIIKKIVEEYKMSLGSETSFKRFNSLDTVSQFKNSFIEEAAVTAFNSTDPEISLLGLDLYHTINKKNHKLNPGRFH